MSERESTGYCYDYACIYTSASHAMNLISTVDVYNVIAVVDQMRLQVARDIINALHIYALRALIQFSIFVDCLTSRCCH